MAHERNRDVENLLARAAGRTRHARAELAAAAHDLFLPTDSSMMGSGMGPMDMAAPQDDGGSSQKLFGG